MKQTQTVFLILFLLISLASSFLIIPVHADTGLIEILYPNAAGDSTTLTPFPATTANWNCTDETPHDSDTTYVRSPSTDSLAYYDLYNIQDTSIPSGSTINTVGIYAWVRSLNTNYRAYFRVVQKKLGLPVNYGGTALSPGTSYELFNSNITGIAQSDLNDYQIGIEITSGDKDPTFYAGRCTQVYLSVNYTLPSQGTSLALNGSITATFNILSQKTMAFTKYPSITETFSVSHEKAVSFSRSAVITLTTALSSLMSYTTAPILNLFGIIPVTFSIDNSKTVSFDKQSVLTLTLGIDGIKTSGITLDLFGIISLTFTLEHSKTVNFLRESILPVTFTPNSIREWMFTTFPSITFTFTITQTNTLPTPFATPTTPTGKGGNAPAQFGLTQPQKFAVAFVLIAACIVVAVEVNRKAHRKKGIGKARTDTERSGRKPRLEADKYNGSRPLGIGVKGEEYNGERPLGKGKKGKWKHPRPKKKK